MSGKRRIPLVVTIVLIGFASQATWTQDLKITIPSRSKLTPVQHLNRQGVDAVTKHQYEKAEAIFLKAYLYDPIDPFTLNNLGYISEIEGDLERALKFYALASEQGSDALIDVSSANQLKGKPMRDALNDLKDVPMHINQMNLKAVELLSRGRTPEAIVLLRQAIALQPANPFTLNNLAVAEEATGDLDSALKYYDATADLGSVEPMTVTSKRASRGQPVSERAAESARQLRKRLRNLDSAEVRATMLTLRGVSEVNENDWTHAKQHFMQAYALNPESAFTLNNLGYVAEKDGDLETAKFFYSKAHKAEGANTRVGVATERSAEGRQLLAVAIDSGHNVDEELDQYSQSQRRQTGPVELIPRGDDSPESPDQSPNNHSPSVPPAVAPPSHR